MPGTTPVIDAMFDGGNILCIDARDASDIRLEIRADKQADYHQWFYFRAMHVGGRQCRFSIGNAGSSTYPEAWENCSVFTSADRRSWKRVQTDYQGGVLSFAVVPDIDILYVALHTPYSQEQHLDLLGTALLHDACALHASARTVSGRPLEVLSVGKGGQDTAVIWIIARQHPAETMAEWFMEGLLDRLLASDDSLVTELLRRARFYLVPNMNPDGSAMGNFRTNAAGIDLNRAWEKPSPNTSPEVHFVRSCMDSTGVDLFLDIHGDEEIPYVFAAGCEGIPGYSQRQARLDRQFREALQRADPEFSTDNGYPCERPGEADMSIACNQVGSRFDCLALTMEIPFVDNHHLPDAEQGWSSQRSRRLGGSVLDAIHDLLDPIREDRVGPQRKSSTGRIQ